MFDFEKEFDDFVVKRGDSDPITSLYSLFPFLTDKQMHVFTQLDYYSLKYESVIIDSLLKRYIDMRMKNKNMGMFNSSAFRKLLESYSLSEHLKGINISSSRDGDN